MSSYVIPHNNGPGEIITGTDNNDVSTPVTSVNSSTKETNYTDPEVYSDPSIQQEGIARRYTDQHKFGETEEDGVSAVNMFDAVLIDAIEYPLVVINNRNVEDSEIFYMRIDYNQLVPTILIEVFDEHMNEQKLNTTQMSGTIRVCMTSPVDKVYKKIFLTFRITDVKCDPSQFTRVTYIGEYYIEGFRQTNIGVIYKNAINANTFEMLQRISELTGLGFAATKHCAEIKDRLIRNINSQRYGPFIEQQLQYSGLGDMNIFDAWVDLYGYIVLVNVKWVMDEDIQVSDLKINTNVGIHGTSNDTLEQKPEQTDRTLTNYIYTGVNSNIEISSYRTEVSNDAVETGTLEHIYKISIGGTKVNFSEMEIQTKQDSVDGEYLEEYNTGKSRPIPVFNFNDPNYTGLEGGYNIDEQKKLRNAWFRKKRQSLLYVTLKTPNFGLQRGTLVNIAIYELDPANKQIMFENSSNIVNDGSDTTPDKYELPTNINQSDFVLDNSAPLPNWKLTGLYYIDGMKWEYQRNGTIIQTLILIKKGITSGYINKHNAVRIQEMNTNS